MPSNTSVPFTGDEWMRNPYVAYPGGHALLSDIEQARMAMDFGGGGGAPRASTPRSTGNNSGAGLVNRNLFRHDNQANTDWWTGGGQNPNRPHEAMDFETSPNASVAGGATVPQYQPTGSVFDEIGGNFYGEPTVQIPRGEVPFRSAGDLDAEPSLFPQNIAINPFDEWWKATPVTGIASVDAGVRSNSGGSIWSGDDTIGNFGGYGATADFGANLSLGAELNVDPSLLNEGGGYPPEMAPWPDETEVNRPPPPGPVGDEWTTSPDEMRRFLDETPGTTGEPTVQVPRSSGRGGDISSFGTFGNPLSLGSFFGTPLEAMRYGTDRFVSGGDVTYAGGTEHTPGTPGYGDTTVPPPSTGEVQIDPMTGRPYDLNSIPEGVAVSPEVRKGELISGPVTGPMSPQAYAQATFGGVTPTGYRDPRGSAIGNLPENQRNFLNMQMWSQSFGGTPNDYSGQSDELTNKRGETGYLDENGYYVQTGNIGGGWVFPGNYRDFVNSGYRNQGVRGIPATRGKGG